MKALTSLALVALCSSLSLAAEPVGNVDRVSGDALLGWCADPDTPARAAAVHVYADGEFDKGGRLLLGVRADRARPDVASATGLGAAHGFRIQLPASLRDGKSHRLYVYGIDTGGGRNVLLPGSGISYGSGPAATPPPPTPAPAPAPTPAPQPTPSPQPAPAPSSSDPIGRLESTSGGVVSGWTLDRDEPARSLMVHVYADAPADQGGRLVGATRAQLPRPGVNQATGFPGNHGFRFQVPAEFATRPLFVHAINVGPGAHRLLPGIGSDPRDATPPSAPAGLSARALSATRVRLQWQPARDPESGVRGYRLYQDGRRVRSLQGRELTLRGLRGSTNYSFEVSAINGLGEESARSPVVATMTAPQSRSVEDYVASLPKGNYCYIDDLVLSLDADIGGDTNASQDWVATLFLGVHLNEMPRFMGATAARKGRGTSTLGPQLSMGIPVYRGSPDYEDYRETELSRRIVAEARRGPFTVVAGGPHTDIYVALRSAPAIAGNLRVIVFEEWNERQDPRATAYVRSRLGSRYVTYGRGEYLALIRHPHPGDKPAWIESLRFDDTWDAANTPFVLRRNSELNYNYGRVRHYRLADVILSARRRFSKAVSMDARRVLPMIERGARLIRDNTR